MEASGRHYLSNYYYLHPKKKRGDVKDTKPQGQQTKVPQLEIAVQTPADKAIQIESRDLPTLPSRPIETAVQTQQSLQSVQAAQPAMMMSTRKLAYSVALSVSDRKQEQQLSSKPTRTLQKKRKPSKQHLLRDIFGQLAQCLAQLQRQKLELEREQINFHSVFELLGGEGWDWLTQEQFTQGLNLLELQSSTYQVQMLYNRLTNGKDMLEYRDCVQRLLVPQFSNTRKRALYDTTIKQIIRGDRLQTVRKLLQNALTIQYFVFLLAEIMESEGWSQHEVIKILRGEPPEAEPTHGLTCDLDLFHENFLDLPAEPVRLLFASLSDPQSSLLTVESLSGFLFPG